LLRTEEYDSRPITAAQANDLPTLARRLGIDADGLVDEVAAFNDSIIDAPFDPAVKDGRAAGSTRQSPTGRRRGHPAVLRLRGGLRHHLYLRWPARRRASPGPRPHRAAAAGLYAAGELVGGLFAGNYPGGSGLTAGAVYGRRAGRSAAERVTRLAA